MNKSVRVTLCILLLSSFHSFAQSGKEKTILIGFNSTGSEFIFWEDNTYGGNVQFIYEITKFGGDFSAIGFKASGIFANGFTGGYGGINLRIDEPFFIDLDALIGYSGISNTDLLKSYERGTTEYSGMAFVSSIGVGYRIPESPLLFRLAYGIHIPFTGSGLNGALNLQLGFRF